MGPGDRWDNTLGDDGIFEGVASPVSDWYVGVLWPVCSQSNNPGFLVFSNGYRMTRTRSVGQDSFQFPAISNSAQEALRIGNFEALKLYLSLLPAITPTTDGISANSVLTSHPGLAARYGRVQQKTCPQDDTLRAGTGMRQVCEEFCLVFGEGYLFHTAQQYTTGGGLIRRGGTSQLDPAHVLDLILKKALDLTHSHMGNVTLYDPDRNDLWMATERGVLEDKKGRRQRLGEGIVGYVAQNKELVNVKDISQYPWNEIFLEYILGTRSELAVPLLMGNDLLGVLNVESSNPNNFSDSDERLLAGLADLAAVALQNARAYEREKHLVEEAQALNDILISMSM